MIVAVGLSPALDRTLLVDELRPGTIHRPRSVVQLAGGKGLNVARAARTLGSDVVAVALLGGGTGELVERLLRAEGIEASVIASQAETRVCTSVVAGDGAHTEFYEWAPSLAEGEWELIEARVSAALDRRPGWLTLSGSMPPGTPDDAVARLAHLAHARGARVAVDTHGAALQLALAERPDVVKVNVQEAADAVGGDPAEAHEAALALHSRRAHGWLTVVTAGGAGAYAVGPDGVVHVGVAHPGAYPVGSGDSFLAGLVVGLLETGDVGSALALGAAAASANTASPGAAVLDGALARRWATEVVVGS